MRFQLDRIAFTLTGLIVFSAAWSMAVAEWMPRLDLLGLTVLVALFSGALISDPLLASCAAAHFSMILYGSHLGDLHCFQDMSDKVYGFTWLDSVRHLIVRLGEHIYFWLEAVSTGGVGKDNTIFLDDVSRRLLANYLHGRLEYHPAAAFVAGGCAGRGHSADQHVLLWRHRKCWLSGWSCICLSCCCTQPVPIRLRQEQRWQFGRVRFKPEIERDFLQLGADHRRGRRGLWHGGTRLCRRAAGLRSVA